mgnify:CR=1 FL=1
MEAGKPGPVGGRLGLGSRKQDVALPDQRLDGLVVERQIGEVHLAKRGRYTLTVKPKSKPGVAVMDLRQVKLAPAD